MQPQAPVVEPVRFRVQQEAALRRSERKPGALWQAFARTGLAVLLSAAVSAGAWQAYRWATTSPLFAITEIRFAGLDHATERELLRRSGLSLGENLFHADLARASKAIEAHPWVASARLERRLPSRVIASVVEYRAVLLVQLGALYLLDDQGQLFMRKAPDDGIDLPVVTGLAREDLGKPETSMRLLQSLHLLDAWKAEGYPPASLSEVRLDGAGATLFARFDEAVQEIRLGSGDFPLKLHKLSQVRAALARRGERAARIDLDNQSRPEWVSAQLTFQR
jgi:cell division protein FtsQ